MKILTLNHQFIKICVCAVKYFFFKVDSHRNYNVLQNLVLIFATQSVIKTYSHIGNQFIKK